MRSVVVGTRGSPLARWQAHWVMSQLTALEPALQVELRPMATHADRWPDVPLPRLGAKGVFVKEIEEALFRGEIDLAIHSLKDLPTDLPPGLVIGAIPPRDDPRDALVAPPGLTLETLPEGARVGTSSLRRRAQLLAQRSDLQVLDLRGNLETRLRKYHQGEYDAILLAAAGLRRLGRSDEVACYLEPPEFLPAVGQGALAVETREESLEGSPLAELLARLHHPPTARAVAAERSFLRALGGGCQVPIAALAEVKGHTLVLMGLVASPDGRQVRRGTVSAPVTEAEPLGERLAAELDGGKGE